MNSECQSCKTGILEYIRRILLLMFKGRVVKRT